MTGTLFRASFLLFSISKYHLIRRFQALYDCSPIAYANLIRVEKAKSLLEDTSLSVTQISEQLGFSSIYTFSRFLKCKLNFANGTARKEKNGGKA